MNIFKIFLTLLIFIFISESFYGQDICTDYTVMPGTAISPSGTSTHNTTINVPDSYTITDVNVTVDISHTWNADLDIYLISPLGSTIELSTDNGGNGDNYNNVTFDDASSNVLPITNTTLSGTYRPEGSLAGLNGQNSSGNWTLRVIDDAGGDGGTINSITLNLCYTPIPVGGYSGPGGIGSIGSSTSLVLWLRPEVTGNTGSMWVDSSGRGFNFGAGSGATFNTNDTNGYSSYSFNGTSNYFEKSYEAVLNPNSFSVFTASNVTSSGAYKAVVSNRDDPSGTPTRGFILYAIPSSNNWEFWTGIDSGWQVSSAGISTAGSWSLQNMFYKNATNGKRLFINNNTPITNSQTMTANSVRPFRIGSGRNESTPDYYFQGKISEVIMFNTVLNTAQRIIINNYLSAKYSTSLTSEDYYTQDNAGNGNFDHHVAGIGEANDGSKHTDSQGTGIVRISNPTTLSNNEFLFWGEETQNPTYNFSTNTTNYTEQLNSRWRVNRQGNLGTVTVSFDISSMDLSGKLACSSLQLVVDDNYNFSSPSDVYNLTIAGNTATATGVQFLNNRYFTLRYTDQIVWDGTNFFNGSGTGNAPDIADSCLKFTVKASGSLNFDAHVREIEVETGATLNIADGVLLETENQVVINGTLDLLGEAQLIQNHTGTTLNSGTGSLKIRQQGTTNLYSYNYFSSPVNRGGNWQIGYLEDATGTINFTTGINADPSTSPITLSSRWLYAFDGLSGDYNSWEKLSTTTNLSPGIGFTMKGSGAVTSDQEYVFRGIPNDGTYTYPVTANTDFLVGNPYPSALDADQFITDNLSAIDGSLYFWESFTTNNSHYLADYEGGYAARSLMLGTPAAADNSGLTSGLGSASKPAPTQYINIGQGFFTTITNTGTLTFNNAQRVFARESLGETIYYKTSNTKNKVAIDERPKVWFSFTSPKSYSKIIGLGYDSKNATYGYDKGYDAKSFDNLKNDFYWLLDDEPLVIQALPEINLQDDLPLGIKISDAGIYKFSIDKMQNIPDDVNIYLLDKNENAYYNLSDGEAQLFLNTGTFNKFSIVFKEEGALGTVPLEDKSIFVSYNSNTKTLELHTKQSLIDIENFKIYNAIGQEIINIKNPTTYSINVSNIPNNVYFLKVNSKNIKNSKTIKFVKY